MLRYVPRRASGLALRRFSSSSNPEPPSPTVYDELSQYVKRVMDRSNQLTRYRDHSVFPPSNWTIHDYYLYAKLQLPTKTEIDAVDFLTGARFACDRVIRGMHSPEVVAFAAENASKPSIAYEIEEMLESRCYERLFLPRVRRLGVGINDLSLTDLDFTGVYLSGVNYEMMTRGALNAEATLQAAVKETLAEKQRTNLPNVMEVVSDLNDIKQKLNNTNVNSMDDAEVVERLTIKTLFNTVQVVEMVSSKTSEKVEVKTEVKTSLSFQSLVTDPDAVDWRIVNMNQFGRVLSRTKIN